MRTTIGVFLATVFLVLGRFAYAVPADVSNWGELSAALNNVGVTQINLTDNISVPANASGFPNQYGRLAITRTVTINGNEHRLDFAHGELIIGLGSSPDDIVVNLLDLELRVWNPTWRTPASAYALLVHRGTLIADNIAVDLRWDSTASDWLVGGAAPAGVTTHFGASPGTQGWTVNATLRNSEVKVFSESLNPYGFYASAGSTATIEDTAFDVSRNDLGNRVQGIAIGLQDELPDLFPGATKLYPDISASGNTVAGGQPLSHAVMVFRASGDLDDNGVSAGDLMDALLAANPSLPARGIFLPDFEHYPPVCGEADGQASLVAPTLGLCAVDSGVAGDVDSVGGDHVWGCSPSSGSVVAQCLAPGSDASEFGEVGGKTTLGLVSDGGASEGCVIDSAVLVSPPDGGPTGVVMPYGAVNFTIHGCTAGSATVRLEYSASVEALSYWKYIEATNEWTDQMEVTMSGNTVTFTIADNGPFDADPAEGVIRDPSGVGFASSMPGGPEPIPTLPAWAMILLVSLLGWFMVSGLRREKVAGG